MVPVISVSDPKKGGNLVFLNRSQSFPIIGVQSVQAPGPNSVTVTPAKISSNGNSVRALLQAGASQQIARPVFLTATASTPNSTSSSPVKPTGSVTTSPSSSSMAGKFVAVTCINGSFVPAASAHLINSNTFTVPASCPPPPSPCRPPITPVKSKEATKNPEVVKSPEVTKSPEPAKPDESKQTEAKSSTDSQVSISKQGTNLIRELQKCLHPDSVPAWPEKEQKNLLAHVDQSRYLHGVFTSTGMPWTPVRKRKKHFRLGREQRRKNRQSISSHLDNFNVFLRGMGLELEFVKIKELSSTGPIPPPPPPIASADPAGPSDPAKMAATYQMVIEKERLPDKKLLYKVLRWKDAFNISDLVYHNLVRSTLSASSVADLTS